MENNIIHSVLGYYMLRADNAEVLNTLMLYRLDFWGTKAEENGSFSFYILKKDYEILLCLLDKSGHKVYIVYEKGLPKLLHRYRRRIGIPVGLVVFLTLLWASTLFIWEIEVVGNDSVSDVEIVNTLEELGCGIGSYIPSLDFHELCNAYLQKSENIAWITVNIDGTHAEVIVRERMIGSGADETDAAPSNLIAAVDGLIENLTVFSGQPAVGHGDTVKAGDLLVSGIVEGRQSLRTVRAAGYVYAHTMRTLGVTVSLEATQRVRTQNSHTEKTLIFFGIRIKLPSAKDIGFDNYEVRKSKTRVVLLDRIKLPVFIENEIFEEYTDEVRLLTEEEAARAAWRRMAELMRAELAGCEISGRSTVTTFENNEYTIKCDVYCLENIAKERKIGVGN